MQAYRDRVCAAGACHGDAPCRTGRRRTHPSAWQVWRGADRGGSTGDVASPPVTSAQATTYTRRCVRRYGQSWHGFCLFPPGRDRTQERDHAPCTVVEDVGIRRPAQRGGLGRDRVYRRAVPPGASAGRPDARLRAIIRHARGLDRPHRHSRREGSGTLGMGTPGRGDRITSAGGAGVTSILTGGSTEWTLIND